MYGALAPGAGLSQLRSMLVTCSVLPSRCTKMVFRTLPFARNRGLRRSQTRDRHAERRRADVVEPDFLEKPDRVRIAAVLAADPELEILACRAPLRHRDLDELADAGRFDRRERVVLHDLELGVVRKKRSRVVSRHAEPGLREVIGAEAEELGRLRDLVGRERAA